MPHARPRAARVFAASLLAVSLTAPVARAQGTARSMDIDVSIRSAALGGASNALFWGDEVDHWGNPALLGHVNGIHYEHGRTQLVPGLASDVYFTTDVVKFGGHGIGLVSSGTPGDAGGVKLDYGTPEATDANGNVLGTFPSYERVRSWGFGFSTVRALSSLPELRESFGNVARWFDISYGMNFKDVTVVLGPAVEGSTHAQDWGFLTRLTPYDGITGSFPLPLRFDIAVGRSVLSSNDDAEIMFPNEDVVTPVSRHERVGWGFHLDYDPPQFHPDARAKGVWAELSRGLHPLVSVGYTVDHARISAGGQSPSYETDGHGTEFAFAHVFSYRFGDYHDPAGGIDGGTSGWCATLPVGVWGGALYEEARFPQARDSGLPDLTRKGWKAWVDPLAIWRSAHAPAPGPAASAPPLSHPGP